MKRSPGSPFGAVLSVLLLTSASPAFAADAAAVKLTKEDNRIVVDVGGKPFTNYYFAAEGGRAYVRPFLYPVLAADGTPVTSDQTQFNPKEHPHHRSLWVAHGDVNGVDHWAIKGDNPPKQRHLGFQGSDGDTIIHDLVWEAADGQPMLNETRKLRFFAFPDGGRGVDVTSVFMPADKPVTFGDTKEAGLCSVRVVKSISDNATVTLATGVTSTKNADKAKKEPGDENTVWGKAAAWCDLSGPIDGKPYGVAVLDHPSNPRHPSTWHVRRYGLLAANVFGLSDFEKGRPKGAGAMTVTKEKPVTFRYRVVVHVGDAKAAGLDEKAKEFGK